MDLDSQHLTLIDPQDLSVLNVQPIQSIRVWGVGRDNGRYVTLWLLFSVTNLTPPPFHHFATDQILADFNGGWKICCNLWVGSPTRGLAPLYGEFGNSGPIPTPLLFFIALSPAYNEFGYNEHSATTSRFLCNKIIDSNVRKFGYNEQPFITNSFFYIVLLIVSGTQCTMNSRTTLVLA